MDVLQTIKDAFQPTVVVIDQLKLADSEKALLVTTIIQTENALARQVLQYEAQLIAMQSLVEQAKAHKENWLQYMWRPMTMIVFVLLVALDSLGLLPKPLAPQMWTLIELGLGGYVIGRSAERLVPTVIDKFRNQPIESAG